MNVPRAVTFLLQNAQNGRRSLMTTGFKSSTVSVTDAVVGKPHPSKFLSYILVGGAMISGMSTGAWMSKNIASFLEENELFVPSDDDDDF